MSYLLAYLSLNNFNINIITRAHARVNARIKQKRGANFDNFFKVFLKPAAHKLKNEVMKNEG